MNKVSTSNTTLKQVTDLLPRLHECFEEWKAQQKPAEWNFNHTDSQIFRARFTGKNAILFPPVHMPTELKFTYEDWRVGWQHRRYGRHCDPAYDLAEQLIELLLKTQGLRQLFEVYEEDSIDEDLWDGDDY